MIVKAESYHVPVLLEESVTGLNISDGTYVDMTFGGGGHSKAILNRLLDKGHLYSFDQDADAESNIIADKHFTFVRSNFRYLKNWMRYYGVEGIDGLLADLGVSSHHFDDETRGFSFRFDSPLDMRMNKREGLTAEEIINNYPEEKLANLFYLFGELANGQQIANKIIKVRKQTPIRTTFQLVDAIWGGHNSKKEAAQVFQALRIEVNHELEALSEMLTSALFLLKPQGRLAIITYHSLEDRIVKNLIKSGNVNGKLEKDFYGRSSNVIREIGRIIYPSEEEMMRNPRSRSAKLRIAEKI